MARRKRRRRRSSYRRNPALSFRGITSRLGDAAWLAGGMIGTSLVNNMLPLPPFLRAGFVRHATKAAVALGLGMVVSQIGQKRIGESVALGGLSAVVVDVVNEFSMGRGLLPAPAAAAGVSGGVGEYAAYEAGPEDYALDHYTGMGFYTGVEGVGMYGAYS